MRAEWIRIRTRLAGKARLKLVLAVAAVVVLGALVLPRVMPVAMRFAVGRSYLRFESAWQRNYHWKRGSGIPRRLEPLMFRFVLFPIRVEIEPGVNLLLDPHDLLMRILWETGRYEPENWQAISDNLSSGAVLLDVGAHLGYYSIKGAVKVGKSGQVVAFEPNPKTLKLLRDNVAASHAANVIIEPIACTDREQMLTLYEGAEDNTGTASLSRENAKYFTISPPKEFSVRGRSIDDVVRELALQRVDAVKVDVEGAEFYVLRGAKETLRRFHPALVVEIVPRQLAAMQTKVEDVASLLKEIGYNQSRQLDCCNWEWTVGRTN
jgi:FkbM family methyltransferase